MQLKGRVIVFSAALQCPGCAAFKRNQCKKRSAWNCRWVINVILSISCPLTHSQFSGDSNISCRCSAESSEFAGCCPLFEDQALLKAIASGDKELQLELLEWAGAVHAQCCSLMSGDGDGRSGLVLTLHRPCKLYQIRLEGLLAPCAINSVVTSFVDAVSSSVVPWVLLSLFGHEDSPSAWKNTQHSGALNGGECHVSVLLFRNCASQVMAVVLLLKIINLVSFSIKLLLF